MKKSANTSAKIVPIPGIMILLILWEAGVRIKHIPEWILPAPSQIVAAVIESNQLLIFHSKTTVLEAAYGFILSIAIALLIAFILDSLPVLKRAINPLFVISQTIPLIVLAVLLPLWFGWGMLPKVLIVILVCFFPIVISLLTGLESVDPDQLSLFRSLGASGLETFRIVKFPAAMPSFFSGLRISATYSIMAAVISEWVGAQRGLGYYMTIQQKNFSIDKVLAAVIIICLLSLLLVKIVDMAEYLLVPWNRKQNVLYDY